MRKKPLDLRGGRSAGTKAISNGVVNAVIIVMTRQKASNAWSRGDMGSMIAKELPPALRVRRTRVSIVAAAIWNGLGMTNVVRVNDRARLKRRALPGLSIDSRPGLNVGRPGLPDRRLRSLPSPSKRTPRRCCADSSARAATAMRLVTAVVIAMAAGADGAAACFAADAPTRKPVARYDAANYQLVRRSIIKAPSHSGPLHDSASTWSQTLPKL